MDTAKHSSVQTLAPAVALLLSFLLLAGTHCTGAAATGSLANLSAPRERSILSYGVRTADQPIAPGTRARGDILNFAHRGASVDHDEHTFAAYYAAVQQGADFLELDVRSTADGTIIILHDANLERTTGIEQDVTTIDFAELRRLAPGIPTLAEVFQAFPRTPINIEIKQEEPPMAATLADMIREYRREDLVIVSSGSDEVIASFRKASQGRVATGAALGEALSLYFAFWFGSESREILPYDVLQIPYGSLAFVEPADPEFIRYAQARGLHVHFWTVDDPEVMERLIGAGADGIMTNRPEILQNILQTGPQANAQTL